MSFYGYVRVSTEKQASEGQSLGAQETMLRGLAMMNEGELAAIFREEGVSGSVHLQDRREGAALLAVLKKGDTVLATRLDRLFRSALDALQSLADFQKRGVRVIFGDIGDTDSTNGKLMLTILAGVAEAERNILRERIRAVKRVQSGRGRYLGGKIPFGHEVTEDGDLILTPEGEAALAEMRRLKAGGLSLRAIAQRMNAQGVAVSHMGVSHALKTPNAQTRAALEEAEAMQAARMERSRA